METFYHLLKEVKDFNYIEWKSFLKSQDLTLPIIKILEGIPQGLKYHPEFCNLKHTYLVCKAISRIGDDSLLEAGLFHDVGKCNKTIIGKNRIYAFGHQVESVKFVDVYKDNFLFYDLSRDIVEKHMDHNEENYKKLENKKLRNFVECDKILSKKIYFEEFGFGDRILNKIKSQIVFLKQRNSKKKIFITVGISGSGKSTYVKNRFPKEQVVSTDAIRGRLSNIGDQSLNDIVWRIAVKDLRLKLSKYNSAVLDATNVNKYLRVQLMANFNDCQKIAIVFPIDREKAFDRVRKDIILGKDRSPVTQNVINKQYKNFDKGFKSLFNEFNEILIYNANNN